MESSTQKLPIYIDQTLITALGVATEPHFSLPKFLLYRFLFSVPNFSGFRFWYFFRYHPQKRKFPAPKKNPGIGNSRDWGTWPVIILRIRLLPPAPCSLDSEDLARAWQARWRFLFSRSRQYSEPGLGQRCSSHCSLLLWQQGLPPTYQKVIVIMVIASPMYLGCPGTLLVFEGHPTNCKCVTSLALPRISTRENFLGRKKHLGFWQFFNTLKCSHSWCFSILEKGRTGFLISVASVASISQPRVSFHLVFQSLSASQWLTP